MSFWKKIFKNKLKSREGKRHIAFFVMLVVFTSGMVSGGVTGNAAGVFTDVHENSHCYNAVLYLTERGIINGYTDNSFKPENAITRAETAAVIVRAANLSPEESMKSTYVDVQDGLWSRAYIMAATKAGIINGVGNNMFLPESNVTHNQIIKMIVCMLSLEESALNNGGWPRGYLMTAVENGILDSTTYSKLLYDDGDKNATRGDVAQYIYSALMLREAQKVEVSGKQYFIGMPASDLGVPDEKVPSTSAYTWYVYGTETYQDFIAAGVLDNKVVALASAGVGFTYNGYKAGDVAPAEFACLARDGNDSNKVHGVLIEEKSYNRGDTVGAEALAGESKMNFHYTNAFRVLHGKSILAWSDAAATAARLHSEDMARQNYFEHDSMDGRKFSARLQEQGISWRTCGENICAGYRTGFRAYDGWVNSSGHRNNMLGAGYTYLGVGGGYDSGSDYNGYFTQDFYAN